MKTLKAVIASLVLGSLAHAAPFPPMPMPLPVPLPLQPSLPPPLPRPLPMPPLKPILPR